MFLKPKVTALGMLGVLGLAEPFLNISSGEISPRATARKATAGSTNDEYTDYVDSINRTKIIPYYIDKITPELGCNKKKLTDEHWRHQEVLERKLYEQLERGHGAAPFINTIVAIDINLALCFSKPGTKEHRERMEDIIKHYELLKYYGKAGTVYYYLFSVYREPEYREKAREDLRKDVHGFEAYLKLTSKEDLPKVRDDYLQQGDHLRAGKIEWYLGNRERGRELILQSREFSPAVEESKKAIQEREYSYAIGNLWRGLRIPFTTEIIKDLCKDNKACLNDLKRDGPHKDQEFFTI